MFDSIGTEALRTLGDLLLVFLCACFLLVVACSMPGPFTKSILAFARAFRRLAGLKRASLLLLFLGVFGTRLAVLPRLSVPVPGIHDEYSYLLLGDTLAHGRLTNPSHPLWMSFETFHVNWFPTYASKYPPGQGAVLALGELLGTPWIGVLLCTAGMCAVILWMLRAWLPPRWALLGSLLVALKFGIASYWMNSYWGGSLAATGGALVLGALPRILREGKVRSALAMGMGIAILANTRPYEGFLLCIPVVGWIAWWFAGKTKSSVPTRRRVTKVLLPLATLLTLTALFVGYYNWRLTGNARLFPYVLNSQTYRSMGIFLWQRPAPLMHYHNQQFEDFYNGWEREEYDHSWKAVECVTAVKLARAGSTYFWWGALLLLPGLPFAFRDKRMRLPVIVFGLGCLGFVSVIWSMPHYAAPFTAVIFLVLVQAMRHLSFARIRRRPIGLALSAAAIFLLAADTTSAVHNRECDPLDWACKGDPSRAVIGERLSHTPGKHLILVRYAEDHNIHDEWVYNGAEIDSAKVLWARDLDAAQNAKLFEYFKDRKIWLVEPDVDNTEIIPYPRNELSAESGRNTTPTSSAKK
jgi:hypothetical protein